MTLVDDPGGDGVGRRVLLVGIGTRGDVEPLVRLGSVLQERGDRPVVAVLADGEELVTAAGLRALVVGPPAGEAMWWRSPLARGVALSHPGAMYQQTRTRLARHADEIAAGLSPVLAPPSRDGGTPEGAADLVVCGLAAAGLVPVLLRAGVPARLVLHAPLLPHTGGTSAWRTGLSAVLPEPVEAGRQRLMWTLTQGLSSALARAQARRWADAAPADRPRPAAPPLLTTSPVLDPDPSPEVVQTGWWADPRPVRPLPEEADRWLTRHPDAVLLSLGSLAQVDPEEQVAQLVAVAARVGAPAVVQVHDARPGPREVPRPTQDDARPTQDDARPEVLVVGDVDHRALLPRVRAVVHHGGSGTTHAAAAAGRPQLVVPRLGDQPHYGRQVHRAGLGPPAVPHTRASVRSLSEALLDVLAEPSYARAATEAAGRMADEDGLGRAVAELATTGDRAGAAR